ncbi:MAG: hypothetical protein SOW50_02985 [Lachnospiraceae bacterium]|nr:hypothetical protein [Lachnospiraceae bacterium]
MTKFVPDDDGIRQLLLSQGVVDMIHDKAKQVQKKCGAGYTVTMYRNNRIKPVATVGTGTAAAEQDNLDNNTLLRNLR